MISPTESHEDNPAYSYNLLQNQQACHCYQPANTSAIRQFGLCSNNTSYEPPWFGKDEKGEWNTYLIEYHFNGKASAIFVAAYSFEEARQRLGAIAHGDVLGQVYGSVNAHD